MGEEKKKDSHKFQNQKEDAVRTPSPLPSGRRASKRADCRLGSGKRQQGMALPESRRPSHNTRTRARPLKSQAPGRDRHSKTVTQHTDRAARVPSSNWRTRPKPALLSLAPPLVASRDVTTPISTPLAPNPAPRPSAAALAPPRLSAQAPPPGRPIGSRPHPSLTGRAPSSGFRWGWLFGGSEQLQLLFLFPQEPSGRPPLPFSPAITWDAGAPDPVGKGSVQWRRTRARESAGAGSRRGGETEVVKGSRLPGRELGGDQLSHFRCV